jgi:hypothetical protein
MQTCPKCEKLAMMLDDSPYCHNCGYKDGDPIRELAEHKNGKAKPWFWIIAFLLVVLVAAYLAKIAIASCGL